MKKHNRTILQSIKKDFVKGFRRLFWFSYSNIKYLLLIKFNFLFSKKNNTFRISLLLPTRERSRKLLRLLNSIVETCSYNNRIEILLLIDEDDKELKEYKEITNSTLYKNLNIILLIKNLDTNAKRNNFLANKSTGDILFPINDDMIFITNSWDLEVDKVFSKVYNKAYCLWVNSGLKYNYLHCDFPMVNRTWFDQLGYIGSEFFQFWYLDTWICDLSFKSRNFFITNKIKTYQYSAHTIKSEVDETHLKNLLNDVPKKDFITWHNTEKYRIRDAKKLLD